ncbi:LicD family protein [Paraclostridium bifermentans]|uniref:LicD family protein n=1 Tax=Paraclostridium bifermentans TaxID=1490 RepID=UPI0006B34283|nr:LicD family protein [Paraclostridium bifermentans]
MDKKFLESEIRDDYLVTSHTKKIWAVQLNLLKKFQEVCEMNNLKFYLTYGSLLGAIRHNGYIPWDDDIDIAMPREDYDKLKEIAVKEFKDPYFYQTQENEIDFFGGGFSRLRDSRTTGYEYIHYGHDFNAGIWIDITAIDNVPNSYLFRRLQRHMVYFYQQIMFAKIYSRDNDYFLDISSFKMKLLKKIANMLTHKEICFRLNKWCSIVKNKKTKNVGILTQYKCYEKELYKAEWFRDVKYKIFENIKVPIPVGYDGFLKKTFGHDYIKLPPLEERNPHHNGYYNSEKSYIDINKDIEFRFINIFRNLNQKQVVIFGAGEMLDAYMSRYGKKFKPSFLVDNDCNKWGTQKYGISIKSPDELLKSGQKLHVIICSIYFPEISRQLSNMGIKDYYIYSKKREWILERLPELEEYEVEKV